MASFEHGPSARAWERRRSRHCLTAHGPSAPERRTRKQFLPIAYFMATFAGTFRCRTRHRRARAKSHSTPHSEEKNFTNLKFHDNFSTASPRTFSGDLTIWWFCPRTQRVHDTQKLNCACVQELIDRQLPEGGWPFTTVTTQWAVEPTALALLALPSNSV